MLSAVTRLFGVKRPSSSHRPHERAPVVDDTHDGVHSWQVEPSGLKRAVTGNGTVELPTAAELDLRARELLARHARGTGTGTVRLDLNRGFVVRDGGQHEFLIPATLIAEDDEWDLARMRLTMPLADGLLRALSMALRAHAETRAG